MAVRRQVGREAVDQGVAGERQPGVRLPRLVERRVSLHAADHVRQIGIHSGPVDDEARPSGDADVPGSHQHHVSDLRVPVAACCHLNGQQEGRQAFSPGCSPSAA
jgi:hypothetical protein